MTSIDDQLSANVPDSVVDGVASRDAEVYGWRLTWRRFRRRPGPMVAVGLVVVFVVLAIIGPWIAPSPLEQTFPSFNASMSGSHLLGTDSIGHDELSQLLYALRPSLFGAWLAVAIGVGIGTLLGLVSGYAGSWVDWIIMRVIDVLMSFPGLLLIIALIGVLGTTLFDAMIALSISFVPSFARLVRGEVLAVKSATYVEAAQIAGVRPWRIVVRHVVPGVLPAFVVQLCLTMGIALIAQGALGFLGLGVQPPHTNLGAMLQNGFSQVNTTPRLILVPGLTITVIAVAFNVIADGLRDVLGRGVAGADHLAVPKA